MAHGLYYTDSTNTTIFADTKGTTNIPGGFSVGLSTLVGFNIYPVKHFSIGAEIHFAYLYQQLGGKVEGTIGGTFPVNSTSYIYYMFSEKGFTFSRGVMSFNIAYLF